MGFSLLKMTPSFKTDIQRDIHQRANDELTDAGLESLYLRYSRKVKAGFLIVHCANYGDVLGHFYIYFELKRFHTKHSGKLQLLYSA